MRRMLPGVAILLVVTVAAFAAWQLSQPAAQVPLGRFMPGGALLYMEAKDFSSLLSAWTKSEEKQQWLKSDNYQAFSRSRLLLRLTQARDEFAGAAGIPPDSEFLSQVAGRESALAWYDIGKLEFVYVSKVSTDLAGNSLWQSRSKFQPRQAGGSQFFVRKDPESGKVVAFAEKNGYLVLGTREDLVAGVLSLMAGEKGRTVVDEPWFGPVVERSDAPGDLRMVLNLDKIAATPYFRSYWVQQNVSEMKQFTAAVCDLYREGKTYREERVLLKRQEADVDGNSIAEVMRFVPDSAGFYRARIADKNTDIATLLLNKLLSHVISGRPQNRFAPGQVSTESLDAAAGTYDLETRIDEAPLNISSAFDPGPLKEEISRNPVRGIAELHGTSEARDKTFVHIGTAFVLQATKDWDAAALRTAISRAMQPAMTASGMGTEWKTSTGGIMQLDGLSHLYLASRGGFVVISDDESLVKAALERAASNTAPINATYAAGFRHREQRGNLARLVDVVDRAARSGRGAEPDFFSANLASLSGTLSHVDSETIVVRDERDRVLQTVTYTWDK